ncbi:MAG: CorA family divalent cation transporter [Patescibacteria group bacterium]
MSIIKGKISWVDILNPDKNNLEWLRKEFKFSHLIIDQLKAPSPLSIIQAHRDYLFLIYYFPIYDTKEKVSRRTEIDFLITRKGVVTVRYDEIEIFTHLLTSLKPENKYFEDPLVLVHKLIKSLLQFQNRQLSHIREKLESISGELFKDLEREREKGLLERISYIKRDISQYRIIVRPQAHILNSFFEVGCGFLGSDCRLYSSDLLGEQMKIMDQLEDYRQAVEDSETTNLQLINLKNSQVIKTFTIMAFLTFPMVLFATLFSMNTVDTPIVSQPHGFWIVLGFMLVAVGGMVLYFKKKDWL